MCVHMSAYIRVNCKYIRNLRGGNRTQKELEEGMRIRSEVDVVLTYEAPQTNEIYNKTI